MDQSPPAHHFLARLQCIYWSLISRPLSFYVRSFVDKDHTLHVWIEGQHVYSSYHPCKTGYIPGSTLWSGLPPYDAPRMIHPDTQPHLDFRAFWSRMGLIHMTHIPFDMICSHEQNCFRRWSSCFRRVFRVPRPLASCILHFAYRKYVYRPRKAIEKAYMCIYRKSFQNVVIHCVKIFALCPIFHLDHMLSWARYSHITLFHLCIFTVPLSYPYL